MATLYVAEFSQLPISDQGVLRIGLTPPIAEQTVAISASSTPSAAFNPLTRFVRITSDVVCSVAWAAAGATPTATATNMRVPASSPEYFGVAPGGKVAVITNT